MDVYPVPPSDFCRQLRELDPNLQLNWDPVQGVWQIWHKREFAKDRDFVMSVVNSDGSYRPLDDRTMHALKMNRFYAENPKLLEKIFYYDPLERQQKLDEIEREDSRVMAKDPFLKKKFQNLKELAASVPRKEWSSEKLLKGKDGKPLLNQFGEPIKYRPHASLANLK